MDPLRPRVNFFLEAGCPGAVSGGPDSRSGRVQDFPDRELDVGEGGGPDRVGRGRGCPSACTCPSAGSVLTSTVSWVRLTSQYSGTPASAYSSALRIRSLRSELSATSTMRCARSGMKVE